VVLVLLLVLPQQPPATLRLASWLRSIFCIFDPFDYRFELTVTIHFRDGVCILISTPIRLNAP
jgi:hypothetical protein